MNVIIPPKRRDKKTSFKKLVSYVSTREEKKSTEVVSPDSAEQAPGADYISTPGFGQLVDYVGRKRAAPASEIVSISPEGIQRVLSGEVLCETNCWSLESAATEMNLTADQNRHCKDAVYHFILSWQGEEDPSPDAIFRSVRYSLKQLGMEEHQYVAAIHRDTDNVHCHVSANRVHPRPMLRKTCGMMQTRCRSAAACWSVSLVLTLITAAVIWISTVIFTAPAATCLLLLAVLLSARFFLIKKVFTVMRCVKPVRC